jgi:hypothetical protein
MPFRPVGAALTPGRGLPAISHDGWPKMENFSQKSDAGKN